MYYILLLKIKKELVITTSRHRWHIKPGTCLYVGRAKKNLFHRIRRHLSKEKKLRWHIDHLTCRGESDVVGYVLIPLESFPSECEIAQRLEALGFERLNFGSSDCRCRGHLLWKEASLDKILKEIKTLEGRDEKNGHSGDVSPFDCKLFNPEDSGKDGSTCPDNHPED
ncbi:MAG: GIY-YIG nuclease family protein [Deferribacteres bacterium]|nr:GIY-YIG nuclease family protein [Deferribacteres bacterium]